MKKTYELSTKVTKLDLDFILDNCFKPKMWDEVWTIFAYGDFKITFEIQSIYTQSRCMYYRVTLYEKGRKITSDLDSINMKKEHRNMKVILQGINGQVYRHLFNYKETTLIYKTQAYQEAQDLQQAREDRVREMANKFLDELEIKNMEVRDAYIESRVDKIEDKYLNTGAVLDVYRDTKILPLRMSYALFTEDEDKYKYYSEKARVNGFAVGDIRKEIKAELAKLKVREMDKDLEKAMKEDWETGDND